MSRCFVIFLLRRLSMSNHFLYLEVRRGSLEVEIVVKLKKR